MTTKDLFNHLCNQMELLEKGKISEVTAHTQAELCRQANNLLKYELDRVRLLASLQETGLKVKLRKIEK